MSAIDYVAFAIVALPVVVGAILAVFAKKTFHSALGLGIALLGISGAFITLGNPFVGVIQILVYVGGILTLLVFAVMFVIGDEDEVKA